MDLQNNFPDWGESGELPESGFFYQGGDQVHEKHFDALWHNINTHFDQTHTAIQDRVRDISGDLILDGGLTASQGTNALDVDLSSSKGVYVDGQNVGSIASTTVTLSTNGGSSTRTDSIWVNSSGSIGVSTGTTSVNSDEMKIAEADVATDDTISAIRNYGKGRTRSFSAEDIDAGHIADGLRDGDIWYDENNNKLNSRIAGTWENLATEKWVNNGVQSDLDSHTSDTTNPHSVTNDQVGAPSQTEFDNHTSDTTNPHSVTNDQVGAPSQTEFDNHVTDTNNPHSVTVSDIDTYSTSESDSLFFDVSGDTVSGSLIQGIDPADTVSETTSPKSFNFDASTERDIHKSTDVSISNSSGAEVTEDVTVELYDGSDTTGTLLLSETQSITLADGGSTTATFIATDEGLDTGTYHIEITQSGSNLSIDQTDEHTRGAAYEFGQTAIGNLFVRDQYGTDRLSIDTIGDTVGLHNSSFNFNQNVAQNIVVDPRTSDPSSPVEGQEWTRTDL